jgi:hypothetical protein
VGGRTSSGTTEPATEEEIRRLLVEAAALGLDSKEAIAEVGQRLGLPKRVVYQQALKLKGAR